MHNYSDELRSPTSKLSTPDVVLTLICFITPARAVFNLLMSLVVSSSSITTTSSPRLRRIQTDWGRGSACSISSTSSSSAIARGTTGGLHGRTMGLTIPYDASGSAICPSGTTGFTTLDSGASPATPASAPKESAVPTVASGTAANPSIVNTARSSSPSSLAAAVDSSSGYRALRGSGTVAAGVVSTMGSALGGLAV